MPFFLILSRGTAGADIPIRGVCLVDVSSSGFSVEWQGQEGDNPDILIFSDKQGTDHISRSLDIIPFPLRAGDPETEGDYLIEEEMDDLRSQARGLGLMRIRVEGCQPETTYYYRIRSEGSGGEIYSWPLSSLASVTTTGSNSFVCQGNQLLVTLDAQNNTRGWMVTAFTGDALFGVSSFVGEGAGENQACINLTNLFGPDGLNWSPVGARDITLVIRRGWGFASICKTLTLDFSDDFAVSRLYSTDMDDLTGSDAELQNAIMALQVMTRITSCPCICTLYDVNGDGKIAMPEVIHILQSLADLR